MSPSRSLLETALQHHRSGNWQQAELLYRQVLEQEPQQADAWHLFGVLAHQCGDHNTAIACIQEAITIDNQNADFHNNLGEALRATQQLPAAIASYQKAIDLRSDYAEAFMNMGLAWQSLTDQNSAIVCYRQAIHRNPKLWQAYNNLGVLLKQQGQYAEAINILHSAITTNPQYAAAYDNLGLVYQAIGNFAAAIPHHQQAISLQPQEPTAYNHLGNALQGCQNTDQAITNYQKAIELQVDFGEAYLNLGNALYSKRRFSDAIVTYQKALVIRSNWVEAWIAIGDACKESGEITTALTHYEKALQLDATNAIAFWNYHLMLPILYENPEQIQQWRNRFTKGLQEVIIWTKDADPQKALQGVGCTTNFYLQYQGQNDRQLQEAFGQLAHQIMSNHYPQWAIAPVHASRVSPIRIGFISNYFKEHTVAKLFQGWMRYLNKDRFAVYGYYTDQKIDAYTAQIESYCHRFYATSTSLEDICTQIATDQLDVLIFTDIGMCPTVDKIAALKLAPIQCLAWGHPITSGLTTIDYFLSSQLMEPGDGDAHYTEKLIRLPGIGITYASPQLPLAPRSRTYFHLAESDIVYLSCQSLYKYLPQYDFIFAEIATQVTHAKFVFIESLNSPQITKIFQERLSRAFAQQNLDWQSHCHFVTRLNTEEYLSLNLVSDIFLDTIDWSGGNTTLEAIACGLPIVTMPGQFMRGRHSWAMLQQMDIHETIGANLLEYISIAVQLGLDGNFRQTVRVKIRDRQRFLYEDRSSVNFLEEFLTQVTGSASV